MRSIRLSALVSFALATLVVVALFVAPTPAQAAFGFLPGAEGFDAALVKQDGTPETRAGFHPDALEVGLGFNGAGSFADGDLRDLHLDLPPGLLLNPTAVEECSAAAFHTARVSPYEASRSGESCPDRTQVGVAALRSGQGGGATRYFGLFNLQPPHGAPAAIGFSPYGAPVVLTPHVREADAGLSFDLRGLSQSFDFQRLELEIWGTPWQLAHDGQRGNCLNEVDPDAFHGELSTLPGPGDKPPFAPGTCSVASSLVALNESTKSYLTVPTAPCGEPLGFSASALSWQGAAAAASAQSPALTECNHTLTKAKVQLTGEAAAVGSGLAFTLDVNDGGGILNPGGIARPAIRRAVISLPEGLTINPSVAAGLGACAPAELAREQLDTAAGAGCPNASKVGDVRIEGLLGLSNPVAGSLFVAQPRDNPFGSLLALYIVARDADRGLLLKSVGRVEPDRRTGRLVATFENLPRLLYTRFVLTLREGQRALLVSPPACGSYRTDIEMTSWAAADPTSHETNAFAIKTGRDGGACPSPGAAAFAPVLQAGSLNPGAAAYSPFFLQMTRTDPEQEITSYSATFPPGLLGRLAGVGFCPDGAIEAAKHRSADAELASPSCPASSRIGRTLAGDGVGRVLAYAPGALYLAGPYHGSQLSTVAITAAKIGPFDLGTVVVRSAIRIDPRTAQASIDARGSDPIPHILEGIPLHVRDIRVYVDRPGFTLNPTNCDPLQTLSTLTGSGADFFSAADDVTATSTDRFQLLNCSLLGFRPRLALRLGGDGEHGHFPSLRAVYAPRPGDANIARAAVTLPPSLFLEQDHIGTVCTRAQFAADACPKASLYGRASAVTPLLDEPLQGPVYLRSSDNPLPDLVASLHGRGVAIEVVGRIDSSKEGGLRTRFDLLPDAPVTRFAMALPGGRRGLLVNAEDLCAAPQRARARFTAHNNSVVSQRPRLRLKCRGHGGASRGHRKGRAGGER